jgi:hypothetical protein
MSRYLTIARSAIPTNEKNEKRPEKSLTESVSQYEENEKNEESPRCLSREQATALRLNPDLTWMHVFRDEVEVSKPFAEWDGSLPNACAWQSVCQSLGPCPRHLTGGPCRLDGDAP